MGNRLRIMSVVFVMALSGGGCTDTAVLDQNVAIVNHAWHYEDQPQLTAHITDVTRPYNIYLNLRHTPDYAYSNVFVLLHQRQPNGRDTTERLELTLAESDGRWLGRGNGSVYTHQHLIKESIHFPDTGNYVFTLEQNMRENPLREITDVGIRVEPAN
ncbi:gliding motility-associated lipoprotein GldH [Parapedobacter indicus]|uniref:Gliding motility-associated lipoprotein GldH n=2 Tax=Parapedobacter indicus TaxID=1477437 RepID=A0A1I3HJJ5_9SPHI|nr:gliding motility-associated lipoprotein GldH [Parapedobacter indicus]SFI35852.1 gliding motility-associated lipoprotein GldH [Parapedobacter indicus]